MRSQGSGRRRLHISQFSNFDEGGRDGLTSLKLHAPRQDVHPQLHQTIRRAEHFIKQDKANNNRLLLIKPKRFVQASVVDEHAKQRKNIEQVKRADT